jgi:selenide,water dikinase
LAVAAEEAIAREVVLLGGGHSHAIALMRWAMAPVAGVRLTLISDGSETPYSGMLPGHVAGLYDRADCHLDLRRLAIAAGAQFYRDRAIGLDLERRRVICASRPPVGFEVLSIDVGSTPQVVSQIDPAVAARSLVAKPVAEFLAGWEGFLGQVQGDRPKSVRVAIAGGGVGGVELALATRQRLTKLLEPWGGTVSVTIVQRDRQLVPTLGSMARRRVNRALAARNINVWCSETAIALRPNGDDRAILGCQSGRSLPCDLAIWVTQAAAPSWLDDTGLALDGAGFVAVNPSLQSCSHEYVFAAGDVATILDAPRPKAGVFAVRQGQPLFHNLRRYLAGQPLRPFRPQGQYLSLIGTGDGSAIAARGSWGAAGPVWWRLKDWIDRRFMDRFAALPVGSMASMAPGKSAQKSQKSSGAAAIAGESASPMIPMYCGGCGSKVGKSTLDRALRRLSPAIAAPDVVLGLDAPDDAAAVAWPRDRLLVQTVDYFRTLTNDPYLFGQIAVNHCLSDLFAMGATPHSAQAIATIPYGTEALQEETLFQLLCGVRLALDAARSPLIGGHTTEGPDLALGLVCNGIGPENGPWRKGDFQIGDVLILTKALGTGTLFAAEGVGAAPRGAIDRAIAAMLRSNQSAADGLRRGGATACTDITGFGLVGHLLEMLRSRDRTLPPCQAVLNLDALPILDGAIATLTAGHTSSLQGRNGQMLTAIADLTKQPWSTEPRLQLLADPQTSGGLLATVPRDRAQTCLELLWARGDRTATAIGEIIEATPPGSPPIRLQHP